MKKVLKKIFIDGFTGMTQGMFVTLIMGRGLHLSRLERGLADTSERNLLYSAILPDCSPEPG